MFTTTSTTVAINYLPPPFSMHWKSDLANDFVGNSPESILKYNVLIQTNKYTSPASLFKEIVWYVYEIFVANTRANKLL